MYGPLVKDAAHGFVRGANYVQDIYEAARAKDAQLIQRLVDAIHYDGSRVPEIVSAMRAAASAGFTPSDQ